MSAFGTKRTLVERALHLRATRQRDHGAFRDSGAPLVVVLNYSHGERRSHRSAHEGAGCLESVAKGEPRYSSRAERGEPQAREAPGRGELAVDEPERGRP